MTKRRAVTLATMIVFVSGIISFGIVRFFDYTYKVEEWNSEWRPTEMQKSLAAELSKDLGFNYLDATRPPKPSYWSISMEWHYYVIVIVFGCIFAGVLAAFAFVVWYKDQNEWLQEVVDWQDGRITELEKWTHVDCIESEFQTYPAIGIQPTKNRE